MLVPDPLHAGSTQGWTGHTLGAAGIVESVFALIALEDGLLPGTLNSEARDAACGAQIHFDNARSGSLRYAMNNSFGFGGNNCSLVFGTACRAPAHGDHRGHRLLARRAAVMAGRARFHSTAERRLGKAWVSTCRSRWSTYL